MEVLEEGIKEFQDIFNKVYGIELTREEAIEESTKLLKLLSTIDEVELQQIEDMRKPYIPSNIRDLARLNENERQNNINR